MGPSKATTHFECFEVFSAFVLFFFFTRTNDTQLYVAEFSLLSFT